MVKYVVGQTHIDVHIGVRKGVYRLSNRGFKISNIGTLDFPVHFIIPSDCLCGRLDLGTVVIESMSIVRTCVYRGDTEGTLKVRSRIDKSFTVICGISEDKRRDRPSKENNQKSDECSNNDGFRGLHLFLVSSGSKDGEPCPENEDHYYKRQKSEKIDNYILNKP